MAPSLRPPPLVDSQTLPILPPPGTGAALGTPHHPGADMHPHLRRQLRRSIETTDDGAGGKTERLSIERLLRLINAYYEDVDRERRQADRAVALMSEELRQSADRQVQQTESRFRAVLQSVSDAILTVRADGVVAYANAAAEELFGRRTGGGGLAGTPLALIFATDQSFPRVGALFEDLNRAERERARTSLFFPEVRAIGKGGLLSVEVSVSQTLQDDSPLLILSLRDLTEFKLAEQQRDVFTEQLARSNVELERFAYLASHDLQEPLRTVGSFLKLIERRIGATLDAETLEYMGFVTDAAKRMSTMIRGLLEHSRLQNGGARLQPVSLERVARQVVRELLVSLEDRGASIDFLGLPEVMADPTQISRLLMNLVANALKFSRPDRAPRISLMATPEGPESPPRRWRIAVADNGIGIAPENYARVFELFQRLHTREEYAGNGLGLAICQRIARNHGTELKVESTLGEGSTFSFVLPGLEAGMAVESGRERENVTYDIRHLRKALAGDDPPTGAELL